MFVAPRLVGRAAGTAGLGKPGGAVADRVFEGLETLKRCAIRDCLSWLRFYDLERTLRL